jgi:hypothetical protein
LSRRSLGEGGSQKSKRPLSPRPTAHRYSIYGNALTKDKNPKHFGLRFLCFLLFIKGAQLRPVFCHPNTDSKMGGTPISQYFEKAKVRT